MLILGVDFETTGLDVKTLELTEVGAVLYDTERKCPTAMMSRFVKGAKVPAEITELTGITQADCDGGETLTEVAMELCEIAMRADFMLAHNGTNFDRPIFERLISPAPSKWIDSSVDVPYPRHITTRKLAHLAAEHGFANPFSHRALFDVLTMLKIVTSYDLGPIIEMSQLPSLQVQALVNYDEREKAKARGYRWDGDRKIWLKTMKQPQLDLELRDAGFSTVVIS